MLADLVPNTVSASGRSDGDGTEGFLSLSEVSLRVADAQRSGRTAGGAGRSRQDPSPSPRTSSDTRPRVLVVVDDPQSRRQLEHVLGDAYAVEVATEARNALDRMAKVRYDALVLDVNLGGSRRGVNVLRVARTLPGYDRVVAVALTSNGVADGYFIKAGFSRCVSKPFTQDRLLAALRTV